VIAVGVMPERSFEELELAPGAPLVVLDGVQDPGNVGTILRTAEAFGACGTVALGGSVDLWNPKVVRSAMGSLFRHVAFHGSVESLLEFRRERGLTLWVADGGGEPIRVGEGRAPERLAIVVGNEGSGVSSALAGVADRIVAIPVRTVESLNVAVATGILLYALTP
jgi:TrmH family RNA methyltransferase